jgi:hypothetical protein
MELSVQIKDRQQLLTILAVTAVALLLLDKIILPPLTTFWQDRSHQIKDLRAQVDNGERLMRNKDSIRSRWAAIQAASLTNNTTVAEQQLYRGIDQWTQSSGMTVNAITPQWKDSSDSSYKTIECRVDASGSIDRVTRFLYDLENDPMALKLQSVELTANDNTGQQLALGVQVSGLVLTPNQKTK